MRIGMITQWYEPELGSAAHPTAIADALTRHHSVRVLTGFPNYPLGKVFDGYHQRLRRHEQWHDIELLRVPLVPSHDNSATRRAFGLGSFAISATAQVGWLRSADVCLVYLSPATVGLAARALHRIWGVPYVVYVQDLWPDSVIASGFISNPRQEQFAATVINRLCDGIYRHAAAVIAIAPSMATALQERGVPKRHLHVIPNWIDEAIWQKPGGAAQTVSRRELPSGGFWLMYAGALGPLQALENAVEAIALLHDRPEIRLALVGDGVAAGMLSRLSESRGITDRVLFLGRRTPGHMGSLLQEADAQLVSLRDLPLSRATIPSKTQSCMAAGMPIIAALRGDGAELVTQAGAGIVCAPDDPTSLAKAIRMMANLPPAVRLEMGARGRSYYFGELCERAGSSKLLEVLSSAARMGGPRDRW